MQDTEDMIDKETIQALEAHGFYRQVHVGEGYYWQKDLPGGTVAINKEGRVIIGAEIGFDDYHFETKVGSIKEFEQLVKILDSGEKSIIERIALDPMTKKHFELYANKSIVGVMQFADKDPEIHIHNHKEDATGYSIGCYWVPRLKEIDLSGFNTNKKTMHTEPIKIEGLEIRSEVIEFAKQMELILRKNDYKGGWEKTANSILIERLENELLELTGNYSQEGPIALMNECVDIANYAMMIRHNLGRGKK